ncbi:universal stress protein [Pikeienuella piscinae]|uniref:Universal stress protein n=1 Tax=Pikeienuella piscinae TaxID=2748098 RepID=A0A7L5BSY4_9RHOB|nr:universal stress protein [Pikeienuella piscinae]QIE54202.1 universal stress protein [Pikeienuella piscinae]
MPPKTILLSMNTPEAAQRLVGPAVELARRHGAHLVGVHVVEAVAIHADYVMVPPLAEIEHLEAAQSERAEKIEKIFKAATEGEDFVSEWRFVQTRTVTASDQIIEQARTADLVIMAQENSTDAYSGGEVMLERTIRKSGRPVLVIPYLGEMKTVGSKVLVGWSATREAARAAHDALPLIAPDGAAAIVTARAADEQNHAMATARELALVYDRHGVRAEVAERITEGMAIGDILLNEAFERGADLIVTGAFGHSRIYDFVIGATTTKLLESMTVPVLFSS